MALSDQWEGSGLSTRRLNSLSIIQILAHLPFVSRDANIHLLDPWLQVRHPLRVAFFCGNLCSLCGLVGEGNHQRHDLSTGLGGSCGSTGNEDGEASVLGNEKAGGSGGSVRETCEGRLRDKARSAHRKGIYLTSRKLFYVPHNE